jgi:metal transporter CNNM
MAPLVLGLMWILGPIAWPTAKLLDYLLGEDHGTMYKKAGLKTLVTLHRTLGQSPTERLNEDEVTIISAVLDLKDKPVGNIMTPIADVFTLSLDTVLDEPMMDKILAEGYSRIPIYAVNNPRDFVGMLLVKMLITYDPEDALRVRDFQLATLPETRAETSCLDIVNFFQEGKSHMVLVSDYPGEPRGALGVLTLEDVIEELIGEEIVDESDVYVDVHKAIRRLKPAPFTRIRKVEKGEVVTDPDPQVPYSEMEGDMDAERRSRQGSFTGSLGRKPTSIHDLSRSPNGHHTMFLRRRSSGGEQVQVRSDAREMRQHLRTHLEPSNVASRPKSTRIGTVKIKPGVSQMTPLPETQQLPADGRPAQLRMRSEEMFDTEDEANESTSLLFAGRIASDGTHALGYGAVPSSTAKTTKDMTVSGIVKGHTNGYQQETSPLRPSSMPQYQEDPASPGAQPSTSPEQSRSKKPSPNRSRSNTLHTPPKLVLDLTPSREDLTRLDSRNQDGAGAEDDNQGSTRNDSIPSTSGDPTATADQPTSPANSTSTLGSLQSIDSQSGGKKRLSARSGSITEQVIEVGGVRKIVLGTTSSSDDEHEEEGRKDGANVQKDGAGEGSTDKKKKKRKKRAGKKKRAREEGEENTPLLGGSRAGKS